MRTLITKISALYMNESKDLNMKSGKRTKLTIYYIKKSKTTYFCP